jgi:hypothetical protein
MPTTFEQARAEFRHEVALTERWTGRHAMKPHRMQSALMYHPARFKWCPSGRRSGKTETAKRHTVLQLLIDDGNGPAKLLIGAPTYTRVKDIYFEDLRDLIPPHWLKRVKESTSELEFRTHWGASIRLVGMNKPQVVEGVAWRHCKFDELADYPPRVFEKHIYNALSTEGRKGAAWMIGVPDEEGPNQKEYEKYWEIGLQWPNNAKTLEHCSFWWPSTDILSATTIQEMAETMDPYTFRQEVFGQFVRSGNRAFPSFVEDLHIDDYYCEYSAFLPLDWTLDFGVRPSCSLICQHYGNQVWIMDEIALPDGSTDVASREFIDRCQQRGYDFYNGVKVYGDAAGRAPGQNVGVSDYQIIRDVLRTGRGINIEFKNALHNPDRKDTVNAIRVKLCDYRGRVTFWIHSRCRGLIEEMKAAPWPDDLTTYHRLAALRYYIYELYGAGRESAGVTGVGKSTLTENQRISARYTRP